MQRKLETKEELDKIQEMIYQNKTFKEMSDYFGGIAPMTIKSAAKRNNLDLSNYKPKRRSPKRRKTLSEEDIAMISESLNNGCFKIDVANKLNISVPTLESLIDYYGIDISNFRRRSFGNTKVLSKDQQVELQKMLDSGVSYKKIGEHFGSSRNIIKVWIDRYDLHTDRGKNKKPKIEDRDFIFIKNMNKKVCNLLDNILRIIIVILILVKIINLEFEDIGVLVLTFILTFYNWFLKKVFKINLNIYSRILLSLLIFLA